MFMEYGPFAYNIKSTHNVNWVKTVLTIMTINEVSRSHRALYEWLSLWTLERGLIFFIDDKMYKYEMLLSVNHT